MDQQLKSTVWPHLDNFLFCNQSSFTVCRRWPGMTARPPRMVCNLAGRRYLHNAVQVWPGWPGISSHHQSGPYTVTSLFTPAPAAHRSPVSTLGWRSTQPGQLMEATSGCRKAVPHSSTCHQPLVKCCERRRRPDQRGLGKLMQGSASRPGGQLGNFQVNCDTRPTMHCTAVWWREVKQTGLIRPQKHS